MDVRAAMRKKEATPAEPASITKRGVEVPSVVEGFTATTLGSPPIRQNQAMAITITIRFRMDVSLATREKEGPQVVRVSPTKRGAGQPSAVERYLAETLVQGPGPQSLEPSTCMATK